MSSKSQSSKLAVSRIMAAFVLFAVTSQAQLPPRRPTPTDTRFVDFVLTSNDGILWNQACQQRRESLVATFDLPITRVVGGASAIDSQGFLADPTKAIANGVISRFAEFRVHMTEGPFIPSSLPWPTVRANVKINGFRLDGYLQNEKHGGYTREFVLRFPSRYLKFPVRGAPDDSPPLPRINKIEFYVDTSPVPAIPGAFRPYCGLDTNTWGFYPKSIEFDAMAPIILVHGNNESPVFFGPTRFNFQQALDDAMVPYSVEVKMQTDSVVAHQQLLENHVTKILKRFGADRFHVIAHSKGGLDSRQFFVSLANKPVRTFVPFSLITLDTPHAGSPGADYLEAINRYVSFALSDNVTRLNLALLALLPSGGYSTKQWHANFDLTTAKAKQFNSWNLPALPRYFTLKNKYNRVRYFAYAADANGNSSQNPFIDAQEASGLGIPSATMADFIYRMQGELSSVSVDRIPYTWLLVAREHLNASFQRNDIAVPVWSAHGASTVFENQQPIFSRNHASVADPILALFALSLVREAQPLEFR